MAILFISDLHLSEERPDILGLFTEFLATQASKAEALYILGDLFEVWLGDDLIEDEILIAIEALRQLTASGVPVYVMVGNRDFLLGNGFEKLSGCKLIPDPSVINLYGTPTLLMHGDTLCTDDTEYQAFRQRVRDPEWQADFLNQTPLARITYGKQARAQSQASTREKADDIMDVNSNAVTQALENHRVTHLIHGHTHRPACHKIDLPEKTATRIVLGDWYQQSSVLSVDESGFHLTGNPQTNWY